MKLKIKIASFKNYMAISKEIARRYHQRPLVVLAKMISARLILNISGLNYPVSRLTEKSVTQEILERIKKYFTISEELANSNKHTKLRVLFKMIWCKIAYGHDASFYAIYGLDEKPIHQCSKYLDDKRLTRLQNKVNPPRYGQLVHNKLAFFERCKSNDIATPDILAMLSEAEDSSSYDFPVIRDSDHLSAFLGRNDEKFLFFKTISGSYGEGAFSVKMKNGNIFNHHGEKQAVTAIFSYCCKYRRPFLIQEYLAPHKDVKVLMPGPALGTFRLVTCLQNDKNDVKIPYAFMKVPVRGNVTDNFQHGETGNLLCGIDVASGKMLDSRGMRKGEHSILQIKKHPDTKLVFRDFTVPFWDEIQELVVRGAKAFPEFKTLGWDVAITDEGLYLIEANCLWDPDGPQITLDRGIKTEIHHLYSS